MMQKPAFVIFLTHNTIFQRFKHLGLFILLFMAVGHCYSQETTKVTATGEYCGSSGESYRKIKNTAIENAEKNALRNSGIPVRVSSSKLLYSSESSVQSGDKNQSQFNQLFTKIASSEIQGKLLVDTVLETDKHIDKFDHTCCKATIEATVYEYDTERDPSFTFQVDGLKKRESNNIPNQYFSGEYLSFEFIPNQDGYLKIFNITADTALILYPYTNQQYPNLSDKKHRLFKQDRSYPFPLNDALKPGYTINIEDDEPREINHLVFVFTKKDIPFSREVTQKKVFRWIYKIPPAQREIKYFPVLIMKKNR